MQTYCKQAILEENQKEVKSSPRRRRHCKIGDKTRVDSGFSQKPKIKEVLIASKPSLLGHPYNSKPMKRALNKLFSHPLFSSLFHLHRRKTLTQVCR